ncbi:MAG: hypothetical protein AAGE89_04695 [Pseudomonadota bacterium]
MTAPAEKRHPVFNGFLIGMVLSLDQVFLFRGREELLHFPPNFLFAAYGFAVCLLTALFLAWWVRNGGFRWYLLIQERVNVFVVVAIASLVDAVIHTITLGSFTLVLQSQSATLAYVGALGGAIAAFIDMKWARATGEGERSTKVMGT